MRSNLIWRAGASGNAKRRPSEDRAFCFIRRMVADPRPFSEQPRRFRSTTRPVIRFRQDRRRALMPVKMGATMRTTIFAYVIAVVGVVIVVAGAWGFFILHTADTPRVPLRYYAMAIGMISGGLGLVGIAQALRLLILIYGESLSATTMKHASVSSTDPGGGNSVRHGELSAVSTRGTN